MQTLPLAMSSTTSSLIQPYPTNDVMARCFIINFKKIKGFIQNICVICIHLDHTFKVASNICYLGKDGKWITQYGSVLVVLNQEGQAVAWQLTNLMKCLNFSVISRSQLEIVK